MSLKAALAGLVATAAALLAFTIGWGFLGVQTGVWIDGCPDVVAAYVEAHGACPEWWKNVFYFALPPVLFASAAYIGFLSYRWLARRSRGPSTPDALRGPV